MIEILQCMKKRKLSNLLILIQLIISFTFFFENYAAYQDSFEVYQQIPNEIQEDTSNIIMINVDSDEQEKFQKFIQQLKTKELVKDLSGYKISWVESEALGSETFDALHIENDVSWIRALDISKGRPFKSEDYDAKQYNGSMKKPYPSLLGDSLAKKSKVKIGDVISDVNGVYYQVVGILKEDSSWFCNTLSEGLMISLDNQLIVAMTDHDQIFLQYYCQPGQENSNNVLAQIKLVADQNGIAADAQYISSIIEKNYQNELKENLMWLSCSALIILFITVATSTLMAARIYERKKEIGVRKAVGYTSKHITFLFSGEFFLIGVLALFIACCIEYYTIGNGVDNQYITKYYFSGVMILYGFLLMLIQVIPACIFASWKLGKMQPKNLIGGKE